MFCGSTFAASVTLAWNPSPNSTVAGYNIYYWLAAGGVAKKVNAGNATSVTISNLIAGATYFFDATTYDTGGLEGSPSDAISYTIPKSSGGVTNAVNQPPTLDAINNLTLNANAGLQKINLTGITSGASGEAQVLTVTAASSNPGLIPQPTVSYASPNATGTLTFTPAANGTGTATITVMVNDGGKSNNIVTQTFTVTVNAVSQSGNQAPTLNPVNSLTLNAGAGLQTVNLSGIASGVGGEVQTLTVTAASSNPGLIPQPAVSYTSPNPTGTLTFTPVANATGSATITVTVNDGAVSNNLVTRTFTVTVNAVTQTGNPPPTLDPINNLSISTGTGLQTVNLSGITAGAGNQSQTLTITATSVNKLMIYNLAVQYTSPSTTGTLTFTPSTNVTGTATITVTVNNGLAKSNIVSRAFTVTINKAAPPVTATVTAKAAFSAVPPASVVNLAASLTVASDSSGQFAVNVSGATGRSYVVEASPDLVKWIPVQTNVAPFTFADPEAGKFSQRYYRAVLP